MNIHPAFSPIIGTKIGYSRPVAGYTPEMPFYLPSKTVQTSSLHICPREPRMSVDCLIIAHLVTTVPLPDSPACCKYPLVAPTCSAVRTV